MVLEQFSFTDLSFVGTFFLALIIANVAQWKQQQAHHVEMKTLIENNTVAMTQVKDIVSNCPQIKK
jgi:hypothetical protein